MPKQKATKSNKLVIYQAPSGAIELRGDFDKETIWATQAEIARVFNVTPQNITIHIRSIFKEGELSERATCKESLQVQKEGKREIKRKVKLYNLDVIIAVGYRINSIVGTKFRQWATKTLKEHITKGYTINRKQIAKNYDSFMKAVADIQALLPEHITLDPNAVLDLIKEFAGTWISLDAYDKETIKTVGTTEKAVKLTGAELSASIFSLKNELLKKDEATELFAKEREKGSVEGIVGNVMQSFGGKAMYPSIEEKAAHLLYFIVKNHPFVDGNKRSGAFSFIWFLRKYSPRRSKNINQATLTALTLLVAESNPKKKDLMTALITQLLK
ncbi:MAG TPA: virulence protein RhuM/Fic/DOC family protein [Candidatus Paceibacterota bacterium]|nr:virulence protein RhuM/Fic/DOC family protein [Candidatus Paceibacterota bacterium]